MKYKIFLITLLFSLLGCNDIESEKKASEVSQGIYEINESIEENIKKADANNYDQESTKNLDGPYPADEYSLKPTGKFYILAVYPKRNDSIWLTFSSKTEGDILKKYSKLKVFKVRPNFINSEKWQKIRQDCLKENMIYDISDEPKGWLLENAHNLN